MATTGVLLGALTACSGSETIGTVSVADLRQTAATAGESPGECPLKLDLDDAIETAEIDATVELADAEAIVSDDTSPPLDPIKAQSQDGLSPIEVAAGAEINCTYKVGGGELHLDLVTSVNDKFEAPSMFAGRLPAVDDSLSIDEISDLLDRLADPGHMESVPNEAAVLTTLHTSDNTGTAAMWVESDTINGDDLRTVVEQLVQDLDQS